MKNSFLCLLIVATLLSGHASFSQKTSDTVKAKVYKVAVFAPLYLDSVFTLEKLRNDKLVPKFIMPAVEFVQGAQIAFDTFALNNERVEAFIYDTKSYTQSLPWLIKNKLLDSLNLMIGSVKDIDFKQLADFALQKNIPFLSATYPNDGGVTANPFLGIINSTLKAHCEGIYSFILQNHGTDKIYLCKKSGAQEDKIAGYFKTLNEQEGKPPLLNIQTINLDKGISAALLKSKLDTTRRSVIIGGSLDESFAKSLADACYNILKKNMLLTLIGMPNWDGFKTFSKKDSYKDFPVYFTTPHYVDKNYYNSIITAEYDRRYKTKPSDMAYKGFQTAYFFTKLLLKYPDDFMAHLNDKAFNVFHDFNFRPVFTKTNTGIPDYYENKHLFVMRIFNGEVLREW